MRWEKMPNEKARKEIIDLLNKALELEHAARIQYLSHAELVDGLNAEQITARLKEIAEDEKEHQEKFRTMIGNYLDGVPSMGITETKKAGTIQEILKTNLKDEKTAIDYYKKVIEKIRENKESLPYSFLQLEHAMRHVIMDEQEHIAELRTLLAMSIGDVEEKI
jgi:bacterioferritin (cytochrome b1)